MIDFERARRALARRDPVLRDLMRAIGPGGLGRAGHADPFRALARAIVGQQLSVKAAATISARFEALFDGPPTPAGLARLSDARLRGVGLSGQKLGYLRDLSRRVLDGSLVLADLDAMTDDEVILALTAVKGIGRWTAEMFLMFRLQRPDVLPVGDLGIVRAMERAYRLRKTPTPERMLAIGECWRPYRTVACWYLWASLDNAPGKD